MSFEIGVSVTYVMCFLCVLFSLVKIGKCNLLTNQLISIYDSVKKVCLVRKMDEIRLSTKTYEMIQLS